MFIIPFAFFATLTLLSPSALYALAAMAWLYMMVCYNPRIN